MTKKLLTTKLGSAGMIAASLVVAGTVASASAAPSRVAAQANLQGYTKDQCKDGGWRTFKNPDGSQMFRNQGQCVSYFASGHNGGGNGNGNGHHFNFGSLFAAFLGWLQHFFGSLFSFLRP